MPWSVWLFLSPPLIGFWLLPMVFGNLRWLLGTLLGAWLFGLAVLTLVGPRVWAASTDADLATFLIVGVLGISIYGFSVGAVTKAFILLRQQGKPEFSVWATSALVLYAIPGVLLGPYFKGV